jgi:hypothetical protein
MSTKILPNHSFLAESLEKFHPLHQKVKTPVWFTRTCTSVEFSSENNRFKATSLPLHRPRWIRPKPPMYIGSEETFSIVSLTYNSFGTSPQAFERSISIRWAVRWSRSSCSNGEPLLSAYNYNVEQRQWLISRGTSLPAILAWSPLLVLRARSELCSCIWSSKVLHGRESIFPLQQYRGRWCNSRLQILMKPVGVHYYTHVSKDQRWNIRTSRSVCRNCRLSEMLTTIP